MPTEIQATHEEVVKDSNFLKVFQANSLLKLSFLLDP